MKLLEVKDLNVYLKTDDALVHAVQGISFDVEKGQTLGIVGESGSGKSVTSMSIMQLLPENIVSYGDNSEIIFEEQSILTLSEKEMRDLRGGRIGMIFQEPMTSLNPFMRIGTQIIESVITHQPHLSKKEAKQLTLDTLNIVKIPDAEKKMACYPHEFSGGQLQRIMIAMAIINKPDLLIADEPTTALDVTTQAEILDLMLDIQKEMGMAIILISHDLRLIHKYSNDVCVMQNGKIIEQGNTDDVFNHPQHSYTQELLNPIPDTLKPAPDEDAKDLIVLENVDVNYVVTRSWLGKPKKVFNAVKNISLNLKKGETLGIVGESGSGKSTLGRAVMQILDYTGDIYFDKRDIPLLSKEDRQALKKDMQMVFQDPFNSLSPRLTIGEIIGEGLLVHFPKMSKQERRERVMKMLEEVNLSPSMINRYPHEFSGGQRQRIAIARAMILEPKFVLLDEPTSALDRSTQLTVIELLNSLQKKYDLSYLFISHDLSVVKALSNHVMVMQQGEVVESGDTQQIFHNPQHHYTQHLIEASNL
ncbi:ABC transporter ATP-binding protein [Pasteurella skyensis]|uniref:ABC-type dipeptide transporter n=1 Tax=Phocoenobacter skyensis TaxID=97481 RepID=A0AAJ6NAG0_9PAST|nr:ABC transporter ATP-binding protein [Pasteurella skyensis]MDP8162732.1 ABC transporter ATP-binding protein [Pasteurella skyensis]MDP8173203.1 ABC transporter ATP-binding protein [Pasteurella skyensis]MDP8177580.1 ABC transporter ATP-binding protein [Pasteurella skyensis]MDP8178834.1 ABC transporter ATP-binding protein [Pasteurella skyensis]MDP8183134.1 ABC transporter ATP-binding protein [Pasteurella skyensis]